MFSNHVVVVDDHPVVAMAVEIMLHNHPLVQEVAVFDHVRTAIRHIDLLQQVARCIVILDIDLPDLNGLDMLRLLPSGAHRTPVTVLVYTGLKSVELEVAALRAGASGYVTKEVGGEGFLRAFDAIISGRSFFSDEAIKVAVSEHNDPRQRKLARLSSREYLIAKRLASGESNKQIAASLFISAKTVSAHKSNILLKLEIDNIVQLISIFQDLS